MKHLETNDWLLLNNMIYKLYTTEDFDEMRSGLLEQLKMVIDFDSADFFLSHADGEMGLCDGVAYNCEADAAQANDALDYSRGILYSGKCLIYRETDIISEEHRVESEYYQRVYRPNNWHYSLQMILARKKRFLGVITLYRTIGKDNFVYDDIFLLDMLKDHLAYRLSKQREQAQQLHTKISVEEAAETHGLTQREISVLHELLSGKDSNEISQSLIISANTAKKHTLNLYRKLCVHNKLQLYHLFQNEFS